MKRRDRGVIRDQSDSPFSAILARLCASSGALGAALVDAEGETVDYGGVLAPYEVKVAAAEWRLVLTVVRESGVFGFRHVNGIVVRGQRRSFSIEGLPDGYAIALCLPRHSFVVSPRALSQAVREISLEAGLPFREARGQVSWARVEVRASAEVRLPGRPDAIWLRGHWSPIIILGRYQPTDLARSELGYLARLASGAEVLLVREPLGVWFIDNAAALTA